MPMLTLKFESDIGPILTVGLSKPRSVFTTPEKSDIRPVRLLIDTGASWTCISSRIAQEMELPILGQIPMRSVTHEVASNLYLADMIWTIGTPTPLADIQLMEFPMANDYVDGLLGRDMLASGLLILNGNEGSATLAY